MEVIELSLKSLQAHDSRLHAYASKLLTAGWKEPDVVYAMSFQELGQGGLAPSDLHYINSYMVPELESGPSARALISSLMRSDRDQHVSFALRCRLVP